MEDEEVPFDLEKARDNCLIIARINHKNQLTSLKRRILEAKVAVDRNKDVSTTFFLPQESLNEVFSERDIDFEPEDYLGWGHFRIWGAKIKFSSQVATNEVIAIGRNNIGSSLDESIKIDAFDKDKLANAIYDLYIDNKIKTEELDSLVASGIGQDAIEYFKEKYKKELSMESALK